MRKTVPNHPLTSTQYPYYTNYPGDSGCCNSSRLAAAFDRQTANTIFALSLSSRSFLSIVRSRFDSTARLHSARKQFRRLVHTMNGGGVDDAEEIRRRRRRLVVMDADLGGGVVATNIEENVLASANVVSVVIGIIWVLNRRQERMVWNCLCAFEFESVEILQNKKP